MGVRAFPEAFDGTAAKPPLEAVDETSAHEEDAAQIANNPDLDKEICALFKEIEELQADRKALNGEISAAYEKLKALGLRKDTAKYLLKVRAFDEDTRAEFELSERIMRSALGIPAVQQDLFTQ